MSEISDERKKRIRESDEYKAVKSILAPMFYKISSPKHEHRLENYIPELGLDIPRITWHPALRDFKQNCIEFIEKWEDAQRISKILRGLKTAEYESCEYESMSKLLSYLGLVESLGVALADMVLILLIANGKEVHTKGPMTKHVTKARELDKIDLFYKLDFLEDEGLELFKAFINRDVRNHVAHLRFTIQNNGEIRKRDGSRIDIDAEISKFWEGVDTLILVFEDIGFLKWLRRVTG